MSATVPNSGLTPGDIIVCNGSRALVEDVYESSSLPGFIAVETPLGVLYLDPELDSEIE